MRSTTLVRTGGGLASGTAGLLLVVGHLASRGRGQRLRPGVVHPGEAHPAGGGRQHQGGRRRRTLGHTPHGSTARLAATRHVLGDDRANGGVGRPRRPPRSSTRVVPPGTGRSGSAPRPAAHRAGPGRSLGRVRSGSPGGVAAPRPLWGTRAAPRPAMLKGRTRRHRTEERRSHQGGSRPGRAAWRAPERARRRPAAGLGHAG